MTDQLWGRSMAFLKKNAVNVIAFLIIFGILWLIVYLLLSPFIFMTGNVTVYFAFYGVLGALDTIVLGGYVTSMYFGFKTAKDGNINYVQSVIAGFRLLGSKKTYLLSIAAFGAGGELIRSAFYLYITNLSVIGDFIGGVLFALATIVVFSILSGSRGIFGFMGLFEEINKLSGNGGLVILGALFITIVPYLGVLQAVTIPVAVAVLLSSGKLKTPVKL